MTVETDSAEIWDAQNEMYRGFETQDRPRIDRHIHPDCTIWDSEHEGLVHGLDGLNEVRAARPTGDNQVKVASLEARDPVIDVWGDVAVLRHLLIVRFEDNTPDERVRNTGVWRRTPHGWLVAHNHEDLLAPAAP
ncbi:MAG: nuclear transport factor 2 family protein [Terrimesophilobacter sp.]